MYKNMIAVTNRHLCEGDFLKQIEYLASTELEGIILREKDLSQKEYRELAETVLQICRQKKKKCILHSFVSVAKELDCPYIHLPLPLLLQYTGSQREQESTGGTMNDYTRSKDKVSLSFDGFEEIGTSVHSVEDALIACDAGATYLTAGHIFETDCKKGLPGRGLSFLQNVCSAVSVPVYGIGGITPDRLDRVMDVGAAGGCIMSMAMRKKQVT
jgi:thiamine-phosphate pyrophosphorylase